ncbi:MAG: DegT/DnrJ/EryC1/StrS family aminotransferase, partial [Bacteroidetes bacterium]|nr:DegT/DnrJ/EryC1/StrS family aminotransferase [Bacteroidota bacterium]
ALVLALKALGVKEGDEVITVPNTFISTVYAISECKAKPVFVDVVEDTQLLDISQLRDVISSKTRAIIPVHLAGQMVDMDPILEIAKEHNIAVVEDACQAHGALQDGVKAGAIGDLGCFSFYPGKNLGAYGDAGMITTNNKKYYDWLMKFRNYGSGKKYYHEFIGRNARMDTVQAAVLNVKLPYLEVWIKKRNQVANKYLEGLANVGDIVLPTVEANNFSAYHLFMIRTQKRNDLFSYLNEQGVQTIIHFPIPIHLQTAYADLKLPEGSFHVAERLANEILSLPMHPNLLDEEIEYVIDTVRQFFT